ncbi:MAG: nitroreductase family protein, partial [Planctomycetes bacterium]|nr:nitroreductase family protein [Planctomycetota bacterium]
MPDKHNRRKFIKVSAGMGTGLALCGVPLSAGEEEEKTREPLPFFDIIHKRRSVRKYESTPVPDEHITRILDAGRSAPTSGNQQPWKFLVIKDPEKITVLKEACIARSLTRHEGGNPSEKELEQKRASVTQYYDSFLSAPLYIVVLTDNQSKYPTYNDKDGPLAAGYIILAARALGYGTVFSTDSVPEEVTRKVFKIPERYKLTCFIPVGVPEQWPSGPPKKELDEFVVYER